MTNIKGLIATEKYNEVDSYIEKLDDTIQGLDFKYSTGNPVCDVIINDKAGAKECGRNCRPISGRNADRGR
jgi:hypothetical protein